MTNNEKIVRIYRTSFGKEPFTEWLTSFKDNNIKRRIINRVDRLKSGYSGDFKFLGDEIYELRLDFGAGYRIYYGEVDKIILLLLCGGDKSSQVRDINKAKSYFKEYKEKL